MLGGAPVHGVGTHSTVNARLAYLGMVLLVLRLDVCLVQLRIALDVGEAVDLEGVPGVERVAVHSVQRVRGLISMVEFNEYIAIHKSDTRKQQIQNKNAPVALVGFLVPWHRDILGLDRGALTRKLLCDLGQ